jgi:hypothetical protein
VLVLILGTVKLDRADAALARGEHANAVANGQWVLGYVLRSDKRMRAYYILAQAAELNGDVAEAVGLFSAAERSIPWLGRSMSNRIVARARALMAGHLALNLAVLSRVVEARLALQRCRLELEKSGRVSVFDGFAGSAIHAGPWSLQAAFTLLEPRRDPRILSMFAEVVLCCRAGEHYAALELIQREATSFAFGLSDSEQARLREIEHECHNGLAAPQAPIPSVRVGETAVSELSVEPHAAWARAKR